MPQRTVLIDAREPIAIDLLVQFGRLELDGSGHPLLGRIGIPVGCMSAGEKVKVVRHFPLGEVTQLRCPVDGFLAVAQTGVGTGRQDIDQPTMCVDIVGIELDGQEIIDDGLGVLASGVKVPGAVCESGSVVRIEPECLAVVEDRLVVFILVPPGNSPAVVRRRARGVEPYRLVIVEYGPVVLTFFVERKFGKLRGLDSG